MTTRKRQRFVAGTLAWTLAGALGLLVFAAIVVRRILAILPPGVL